MKNYSFILSLFLLALILGSCSSKAKKPSDGQVWVNTFSESFDLGNPCNRTSNRYEISVVGTNDKMARTAAIRTFKTELTKFMQQQTAEVTRKFLAKLDSLDSIPSEEEFKKEIENLNMNLSIRVHDIKTIYQYTADSTLLFMALHADIVDSFDYSRTTSGWTSPVGSVTALEIDSIDFELERFKMVFEEIMSEQQQNKELQQ